ncbi:MAG: ATP-binding protein [Chlorobiales bacterium]|nr:ATP-binding protein [Chlorobiales bacterium]
MAEAMKQTLGGFAIGDRFWDRETEMQLFIEKVDSGAHLSLVAQRRMGKTSLMLEAARRLQGRYIPLYVDLQEAFNAPDAIARLGVVTFKHKPLQHKIVDLFSNAFASIRNTVERISLFDVGIHLRGGIDSGNWSQKGDALLAILAAADKPVLLMFDEVPILVNRMLKGQDFTTTPERKRDADEFMSWLRRNSLEHQGKIRMVLTGSIGFEPVLHQAGLGATLNTFQPFRLKPWDRDTAIGCMQALAKEYEIEFPDGAENDMVEMLGCCIPNHVQMFFSHVKDHCVRNGRRAFLKSEVAQVYTEEMLGTRGHAELTHYEERLKMVLGTGLLPLGLDMLSEAAVSGCLSRETLKALQREYTFDYCTTTEAEMEILAILEHDGYLHQTPQGYVFVSNLVRDWWHKRYGMFFTSVLERGARG